MKKIVILLLLIPFINHAAIRIKNVDDPFILASSAFQNKGVYPKLYSCDSLGISPTLNWSNVPAGTKSFAITMHHFPKDGEKHVYMVLYNIPSNVFALPQGVHSIGDWGCNTQNRDLSYSPPCSKGPGPKTYIITAYALSENVNFNTGVRVTMDELLAAIKNITLSTAQLEVTYAR